MSDVAERVRNVVARTLKVDYTLISDDARFVEDLGADSIKSVELVAAFEEEFDIEMDDEAALGVKTVGKAINFIHENGEDYMVQADVWVNENSGSGDATLNITALGGDVDIYGNVKSEAETSDNSGDATATLDISATGDVLIDENEDDTVKARASVEDPDTEYEGDATATLNITAGDDVFVYDNVEAEAYADGDAGDADAALTIIAGRDIYLDDDVDADADTENESGDASATLTINAGRDVTITDDDVEADAYASYSGNATALLDIDAGRDVLLQDDAEDTKADAYVEYAKPGSEGDATATVTVNAGGDLTLDGSGEGDGAELDAAAETSDNSGDATASITIVADNVYLYGDEDTAEIDVDAEVDSGGNATGTIDITTTSSDVIVDGDSANIDVDASTNNDSGDAEAAITINAENVTVSDEGEISADADTDDHSGDATATVDIDASGDVTVEDGEIRAGTEVDNNGGSEGSSSSATSAVNIDAAGDVTVGEDGDIVADADIDNYDNEEINTFTGNADADVYITALGLVTVDGLVKAEADVYNKDNHEDIETRESFDGDIYSGNSYANVTINNILGLGVTVGTEGEIIADSAFINYDYPDPRYEDNVYSGEAVAGIDIQTCGDVIVNGLVSSKAFIDPVGTWDADYTNDDYSQKMTADVIIKAFGDVIVNSEHDEENGELVKGNGNGGSNGQILALASDGEENSAGITVLAVGDVIVNDGSGCIAQVVQSNGNGYIHSPEEIRAEAYGKQGSTNSADVRIATREGDAGNVEVSGQIGAHTWMQGSICSTNTSTIEIYADQDVIVNGGYAEWGLIGNPVPAVLLNSAEGGQILAMASNGHINTADVDIYAGRDVIVHGAELEYTELIPNGGYLTQGIGGYYDGGQILALTYGNGFVETDPVHAEQTSSISISAQRDVTVHDATITGVPPLIRVNGGGDPDGLVLAGAHGHVSILDADVVICAQDDVTIDGEVIAEAGTTIDYLNEHYADIAISAGDEIAGTGWIYAEADPSAHVAEASIVLRTPVLADILIEVSDEHFGIRDNDNPGGDSEGVDIETGPVDCPECDFDWIDWDWCVDCEDLFAPVAPLAKFEVPRIEGCPALTQAAAMELGITGETLQVGIGNALALNPSIQPCEACATLVSAASILRDEDGSRMAAMVQTFNALAPADTPFSPEMATSIAMAFEGAAEGSQYASAMEYIDAFVQYVAVLDTELGAPVGDSLVFVMDKYGAGITGSDNANLAEYVAARLAALGG